MLGTVTLGRSRQWLATHLYVFLLSFAIILGGEARATTFCGVTLPAEIVTQAAALKNDPDLIYEYVYNNIRTLPQYGSLKGPLGTLLDGAGTAVDQAELMASLLQAAGYATAKYQTGSVVISASLLTSWLGTDNSPYSAAYVLLDGGFDPTIITNMGGTQMLFLEVPWAWVKVQVGGTYYVFDPAGKAINGYNRSAGISGLAGTALGYSKSTFLNGARAGATINPTNVAGLNRNSVRSSLKAYSENLVRYIRANDSSASTVDIVGGTAIVPLALGTQQRVTSLPYETSTPNDHTCLPGSLRTTVSLTVPGAKSITFNTSDIYGRRLSLFFDSSVQPVLRLDGVVQVTGKAATPGDRVTLTTSITHPYLSNTGVNVSNDQTLKVTAAANGAFLISSGWGPVGRGMVEKHRVLLHQNAAQHPDSPNAESVLGESLAMLGYTWLAQSAQVQAMTDQLAGTVTLYHHAMGIVGTKPVGESSGPFVDLPINPLSIVQRNARPLLTGLTPLESAAAFTEIFMGSVLESGVLEQTQPGAVAVSTAKLLDIASVSDTIYDINNSAIAGDDCTAYASVGGIRSLLSTTWSYSPPVGGNPPGGDLGRIDTLVDYWPSPACSTPAQNARVIAPLIGNITVNGLWTGVGYYELSQAGDGVGAIISGGLSGGEPASVVSNPQLNANTAVTVRPSSTSAVNTVPGTWTSAVAGALGKVRDPVNRVTGSYTYESTDLTIGSAPFPLGLAFQRYYDSSTNLKSGPLGLGWTHNMAITAQAGSDGFEGMGINSPINGAPTIAALYVAQDILNQVTSTAKPLDVTVIANQIVAWLAEQLINNIVVVTQPENVSSFVLLADGTYNPPFGSADRLTSSSGAYTLTGKDGTVITFNANTHATPGAIASWRTPAGPTVTYSYDGTTGNLTSASTGTGPTGTNRTLTLSYTSNRVTSVADGMGRSVSYSYDSNGNLTQNTDPAGNVTTYAYDPSTPGRLLQYFTPAFPSIAFITNTYDALGRVVAQTDATGSTTQLYFAGTRTELVDALGDSQILYFSARGKALVDIDGLGNQTLHTYDGLDRLTGTTFPAGSGVAYTYDAQNNPLTITRTPVPGSGLSAVQQSFIYDPLWNKVTTATDPRGVVTQYRYDAATGNLLSMTADAGGAGRLNASNRFTYDSRGQVLTATDPLGVVTQFNYHPTTGDLTSLIADAGGAGHLNQTTTFAYDSVGNVTALTDPNGHTTITAYDALRRQTVVTAPAPFNADPLLVQTVYGYDPDGRVTSVTRTNGSTPQVTRTTYTPIGQVSSVTDPNGNVTRHTYDAAARLQQVTDALGRSTRYTYNARGQLATVIDATGTTSEQYTYSANGPMLSVTDAGGNVTRHVRDGFDRVSETTYAYGTGLASSESFGYDANDNVVSHTTRAGQTISFAYDALNRLCTKTIGSSPTACTAATSADATVWRSYDLAGRLTGVRDNGASVVSVSATASYAVTTGYDALNRPLNVSWSNAPAQTTPTGATVTFTHGYNAVGQRISQGITDNTWGQYPSGPSSTAYTVNSLNQYTAIGGTTPTYDGNGNLTYDGTFSYCYDAESRLMRVITSGSCASPGTTVASYAYDAQGRRKNKTIGGTTTVYVTDADNREVLEYDGSSGAIKAWYPYGPGLDALNRIDVAANTRQSFIPDIQGSIVATLASDTGTLTKRNYLPFGESSATTGSFAYTGLRIDPETNELYYARARIYSPRLGRFVQPDPLGYADGTNLYAYVGNDPLNLVDPQGLAAEQVGCGAFGGCSVMNPNNQGSVLNTIGQVAGGIGSFVRDFAIAAVMTASVLPSPAQPAAVALRTAGASTAISTFRYTTAGETFFHYGYAEQAAGFAAGLRPGGFATSTSGLTGTAAQRGLALPRADAPNAVYTVTPNQGTLIRVNPVTAPKFSQPGGLPEFQFPAGTSPGSISAPRTIVR